MFKSKCTKKSRAKPTKIQFIDTEDDDSNDANELRRIHSNQEEFLENKLVLTEKQRKCYLGSCSSIQDFMMDRNFSANDVLTNIVYLFDEKRGEYHCVSREGFREMMKNKENQFGVLLQRCNKIILDDNITYQKLITGKQSFFIDSKSNHVLSHMRKKLPAFYLVHEGEKPIVNNHGIYGIRPTVSTFPTYSLKLMKLSDLLNQCLVSEVHELQQLRIDSTPFTL